jgi:pimeloyl-ACP methyl ester carboxylesterase
VQQDHHRAVLRTRSHGVQSNVTMVEPLFFKSRGKHTCVDTRPKFADLQVHTPTRILWGKNDIALLSEQAQETLEYCAEGELTYFPAATHWLQHEEPEQVNDLLIEFLRRAS